jgi:hypothetical protein
MRPSRVLNVAPLGALALMFFCQSAFGAAQLAAGAKTSAAPTATNPQQRQLQITFDPEFITTVTSGGDFRLDNFQLSVQYDATKLTVDSLFFVPPFQENIPDDFGPTLAGPAFAAPTGPQGQFFFDNGLGLISFISGFADPNNVPPGDVNNFLINFILKDGVSLDDELCIKIFANPLNNDFTHGTDPNTGQTVTSFAPDIEPTELCLSFNQLAALVPNVGGTVPLPSVDAGVGDRVGTAAAAGGLRAWTNRVLARPTRCSTASVFFWAGEAGAAGAFRCRLGV